MADKVFPEFPKKFTLSKLKQQGQHMVSNICSVSCKYFK